MPSAEHEQTPIKVPNFLSPRELREEKRNLVMLENTLQYAQLPGGRIGGKGINQIREAIGKTKKRLQNAPPENLTGAQKDRLSTRIKHLEEKIQEGMPTDMEMRRNPTGAVDKHMRWERRQKTNILEWKNLQRGLHGARIPIEESNALCNVERLRPGNGGPGELGMDQCQVVGRDFYDMSDTWNSPHPKAASYEELFGDRNDPKIQAALEELQERREAMARMEEEAERYRKEIAEHRARAAASATSGQ